MSRSCRPSWPTCATLLDASDIRSLVSRKLRMILSSGEFRRFSCLWPYVIPVGTIARDRAGKAFKVRPS